MALRISSPTTEEMAEGGARTPAERIVGWLSNTFSPGKRKKNKVRDSADVAGAVRPSYYNGVMKEHISSQQDEKNVTMNAPVIPRSKRQGRLQRLIRMPKQKWMAIIWDLFEDPSSSPLAYFLSVFGIVLILLATTSFVMQTVPGWEDWEGWWYIEIVCISYFVIEYVLRLLSCPSKLSFAKSMMNMVDLGAILPFFIELALDRGQPPAEAVTVSQGAGAAKDSGVSSIAIIRVVRLARVFRVLKLTRHSSSAVVFRRALEDSVDSLSCLVMIMVIAFILFSSCMYFVEPNNTSDDGKNAFRSIPASLWWAAVTLIGVGYGSDAVAQSIAGKLVSWACLVVGIFVLALPVSILGSNFKKELDLQMMYKDQVLQLEEAIVAQHMSEKGVLEAEDIDGLLAKSQLAQILLGVSDLYELVGMFTAPEAEEPSDEYWDELQNYVDNKIKELKSHIDRKIFQTIPPVADLRASINLLEDSPFKQPDNSQWRGTASAPTTTGTTGTTGTTAADHGSIASDGAGVAASDAPTHTLPAVVEGDESFSTPASPTTPTVAEHSSTAPGTLLERRLKKTALAESAAADATPQSESAQEVCSSASTNVSREGSSKQIQDESDKMSKECDAVEPKSAQSLYDDLTALDVRLIKVEQVVLRLLAAYGVQPRTASTAESEPVSLCASLAVDPVAKHSGDITLVSALSPTDSLAQQPLKVSPLDALSPIVPGGVRAFVTSPQSSRSGASGGSPCEPGGSGSGAASSNSARAGSLSSAASAASLGQDDGAEPYDSLIDVDDEPIFVPASAASLDSHNMVVHPMDVDSDSDNDEDSLKFGVVSA